MTDRSGLHIYLPEPERRQIAAWAKSESRSTSNLVMHIVRQALAERDAPEPVKHAVSGRGLSKPHA